MSILEAKKGEDILLLDIHEIASFTDHFVFCSASSDRQLESLAHLLLREVKTRHHITGKIEGQGRSGWLLMDFGDVIVHLFSPEMRVYYQLEELWSQGKVILHLQ